jgi:hypothetical protein
MRVQNKPLYEILPINLGANMLAQFLAFIGSLFNLLIDTIYKIGLSMLGMFLIMLVLITGFALTLVWLLV